MLIEVDDIQISNDKSLCGYDCPYLEYSTCFLFNKTKLNEQDNWCVRCNKCLELGE